MRRYLLVVVYCFAALTAFGQNYSLSLNCQSDTNFIIHLGGLLDGDNYQQPHLYSAAGWPDYKHLPVAESLDSFVVTNNGLSDLTSFKIISGDNNIYKIEDIAQSCIPAGLSTTEDSIYRLYRYVSDHNFYFYVPEMESREFKEVTRHFGIYGYGHCGSIANCATLLGKKLFGPGQRYWTINNEDHGISEVFAGGKYYYVDADEEMMVKGRNNKNYISFGEAYEDLFLYYRTKPFGTINYYSFPQSTTYAVPRYFNKTNHNFSGSYANNSGNCYVNDTVGNYGPELYYCLKSGERMKVSRHKDSSFGFHHRPGSYCTNGPYGYLPEQNTVFPAIHNVQTHYDLFATDQTETEKFLTSTNTQFSFVNHSAKPTSFVSPTFTVQRLSQFPLTGGQVFVGGSFNDQADSLQVYVSFNGTTWLWMKTLTNNIPSALIPLDTFIKPNTSLAKYNIYFKVKFYANGTVEDAILSEFNWDLSYQISRYLYPTFRLGDNQVKLEVNGNLQPSQINCHLYWAENSENIPPLPPQYPIFPANGSTLNKTDIRFRWEQIESDAEGDSIWEWQFQLSEDPNFRTILANNFDYSSMLKEGNKAYYYNYFDTLHTRNTFFSNNSTYYWRVRVRDIRNAWSNWSSVWNFTVLAPQAVHNTHFELIAGNSNQLSLKWKKALNDNLTSAYQLLIGGSPTSLYLHNTQVTNIFPTTPQYLYNIDSSKKAFRIFALDNANNCSPPAPIVTLPDFIKHQILDTMDLANLMESLQHPFPNYPSLGRNYYLLYDTTYFESISPTSIRSKQKGRTIISICYSLEDDTIYKKQLLVQVQDFANLNAICNGNEKYVTIDAPISRPITVSYQLNGVSGLQVLTTVTDSIHLGYGDSILIEQIWNSLDTILVTQMLKNNTLPLAMSWSDLPYNCSTNQSEILLTATGVSPLIFSFNQNGIIVDQTLNSGSNVISFENGVYDFLEVKDSFQCSIALNAYREYSFDSIGFLADNLQVNCDSLRMEMPIHLQGNSPWKIFYSHSNGILDSIQTDQSTYTIPLPNNQYYFLQVGDSTGCVKSISISHEVNYIPLTMTTDTVAIDCNANIQMLNIQSNGIYPLTIFHEYNGVPDSVVMFSNNYPYVLSNGFHHFSLVRDSLGCSLGMDTSYSIDHEVLDYSISPPYYDCDSHKTHLHLSLQGNPPYSVYYSKNGVNNILYAYYNQFDLWMDSSDYRIDSIRGGTCVIPVIGTNHFHFTYSEPQISFSTVLMNCITDSMFLNYNMTGGTIPSQISGIYNGTSFTKTLYALSGKISLNTGSYSFSTLSDSTGCAHALNHSFVANLEKLHGEVGEPVFQCNTASYTAHVTLTGTAPFFFYYRKDLIDSVFQVNSKSFDLSLGNGYYLFDSVKDAYCTKPIITPYNYQLNSSAFSASIQPLSYNCTTNTSSISISTIGGLAPFTLVYTLNGMADSLTLPTSNYQWILNNGTYWLQEIHDAQHCVTTFNTTWNVSNNPLQFQLGTTQFDCDSNKGKLTLTLQGNPPYTIYFRKNGLSNSIVSTSNLYTFYLPNGTYIYDSVKDQHCTKSFSTGNSFVINYQAPSASISNVIYDCNNHQAYVNVSGVSGIPPYTFDFTFNGVANSLQTTLTTFKWILLNGLYEFVSVTDSLQCPVFINQTNNVTYQPLSCQISNPVYQCDSNKTKINFTLQGSPPFSIYYRKNNVNLVYTTSQMNPSLMLMNGSYIIDSVSDLSCSFIPAQPLAYSFNYQPFSAQFFSLPYQCDSSHHHIQINASGNPPYQLHYLFNSGIQTQYFSQSALHKNLVNGTYFFTSVTDTVGCVISLNQNVVINSTPLSWTIQPPLYQCDSNKTRLSLQFNGTPPWRIYYRKNNVPTMLSTGLSTFNWFLNNGTYILDSIADLYCSKPVTTSNQYNFNYQPLIVSYTIPAYDCDSNTMKMGLTLTGNSPFSLFTTLNGINDTTIFNSSNLNYYFENGQSVIQYVKDATNCSFPIYESYQFNQIPLEVTYGTPTYNCSTNLFDLNLSFAGAAPYTLDYSHNGTNSSVFVQTSSLTLHLDEGNWLIKKVTDNRSCIQWLNQVYSFPHTNFLSHQVINNSYNCALKKHQTQLALQGNPPYWIYYRQLIPQANNYVITITSDTATLLFSHGSYIIDSIKDNYSCPLLINLTVTHILDTLSYSILSQVYDCDSSMQRFNLHFNGQGPWTLQYKNLSNNLSTSILFWQANAAFYLPGGQFEIQTLSDQTCSLNLHDTIQNAISPIQTTFSPMTYSCGVKKLFVVAQCSGGITPYTLEMTKGGQPLSQTLTGYDTIYLENNTNYVFNKIVDAMGCEKIQNVSFTTNYSEPEWQPVSLSYNCLIDSTLAVFHVTPSDSVQLVYEWNQSGMDTLKLNLTPSIHLANGQYHWIHLVTKYGCIHSIDSISDIDEHPNQFKIDSSEIDCSESFYRYHFSGSGKLPISLNYLANNIPQQITFYTSPAVSDFTSGLYVFQNSIDLNGCSLSYDITDTLKPFTPNKLKPILIDQIISIPTTGITYTWYKNDSIIKTNAHNEIISEGNGTYYAEYIDSAGCNRTTLPLIVSMPLKANIYPNPVINVLTIRFNDHVDFWEFEIRDVSGSKIQEGLMDGSPGLLNVEHLAKGFYYILIRAKTLEHVYRFTKG